MGTRSLICVFYKGQFVIAQYSQWDGYPDVEGVIILKFLLDAANIEYLKSGLEHIYVPNEDELKQMEAEVWRVAKEDPRCQEGNYIVVSPDPAFVDALNRLLPSLSRDTGAKILELVAQATAEKRVPIRLCLAFVNQSDCEWAYVVDLDDGIFEVHEGGFKKKKATSKRFNDVGGEGDRVPKLIKRFSFAELPIEEDLVAAFRDPK